MKKRRVLIIISILILGMSGIGLSLGLRGGAAQVAPVQEPDSPPVNYVQMAASQEPPAETAEAEPGTLGEEREPVIDPVVEPFVEPVEAESATALFDMDLFKRATALEPESNIVLSPLSVRIALTMAYNGASGVTRDAISRVLGLSGTDEQINTGYAALIASLENLDEDIHISIANSLWANLGMEFYPSFLDLCHRYYDAEVASLDLTTQEAVDRINAWIEKKTKGLIKQTIREPFDPVTALCLINTIYLKAKWSSPFDPKNTAPHDFHNLDGMLSTVEMMHQSGDYAYREDDRCQGLMLPYGDGSAGMYFLLPKEGVDYAGFVSQLNADAWDPASYTTREGLVAIPKLNIQYRNELSGILAAMGMGPAFTGGFDLMGKYWASKDLFLSGAIHQTDLRVDEEGTEAAAVTVLVVCTTALPGEEPFQFTADRPFVLAIVDRASQTPLFIGSIVAP